MSHPLAPIFYSLLIVLLLFLLFRELVCWYWKLNEIVLLLRSIDRKLPGQSTANPAPAREVRCPKCYAAIVLDDASRVSPGKYVCAKCGQRVEVEQAA
ncbi:MAG: hypothetical protein RBU25_04750 [Lentisphaeria bacterium]|nr:hypothetical protein [Lentisphaeria bacterium]